MIEMAYIILTAPHGSQFLDDVIAPFIVDELEILLKNQGHEVIPLINRLPRSFQDMNRPASRNTSYRKVMDAVLTSQNKPDFLLDIHGFPDNTDSPLKNHDIVVLRSYPRMQKDLPATYRRLFEKFRVDKLKIGIQNASVENDVVKQALKNKVPAILVEHNELGPVGVFAQTHLLVLNDILKDK